MSDPDFTYDVIGAAMEVHREIGPGIHEKPYENALRNELRFRGYRVDQQKAWPIFYKQQVVGDCITDLIIDQRLAIEVKALAQVGEQEETQLLNYMKI